MFPWSRIGFFILSVYMYVDSVVLDETLATRWLTTTLTLPGFLRVAAQVLYAVGMRRPQSESLRFAFTAADLQMFSPSFEYSFVGAANLARTAAYRRVQQNVNEGKKSRATAFLQQVVKRRIAIEEHADLGDDLHDFLYSKPAPEEERTKHFKDSHHQEHVHEPTSPPVKKKQRPLGVIRLDYG